MNPFNTQQHMGRMKASQHVSRIADMKENNTWKHTYKFQPMPVLDEETYNWKNEMCHKAPKVTQIMKIVVEDKQVRHKKLLWTVMWVTQSIFVVF